MLKEKIEELDKEAQKAKMSFENYYKKARATGLTWLKVDLTKGTIFYKSKTESYTEDMPKITINKTFDKPALTKAYKDLLIDKIDYMKFMDVIAKSGCDHYVIDMEKELNTFYNKDESLNAPVKIAFPKK